MSHKVHYPKKQVIIWLKKNFPDVDWTEVEAYLPPVIWRARWDSLAEKFGLPYTRRYVQNLDCNGKGPGNIKVRG